MINRSTVKALGLKPVTRTMCYDLYIKINSEFKTSEAIKESVSWWQNDCEKLNTLWWVLNYYSDLLDPDRNLRAFVERYLDSLAKEKDDVAQT
ncbi:MAG: hypothetical protein GY699_14035 [Desulfobacteraceae bacterium]|nr:hypothetical protein [Desulfobacteraceae bacterium]